MVARSRPSLDAAYREVLDPLSRVFLKLGIGAGEFATLCKISYVRAAAAEHRKANGYVNRSRVAVVTGLTRPEVARLLRLGEEEVAPRAWHRHRAARVLDGWYADPAFRLKGGRPMALRLRGAIPSFESLVRKYGGDITTRAVLQELLDVRAISRTDTGLVRAKRRSIVGKLQPRVLARISAKTGNYVLTLLHNMENPDDQWYEQSICRRRVSAAMVPYLQHEISARGDALLRLISDQLSRPRRDIRIKKAPSVKFGVSFFVHMLPEGRHPAR